MENNNLEKKADELCHYYRSMKNNGTTFINPNERLQLCRTCDGKGTYYVNGKKTECEVYKELILYKIIK